MSLQVKDQAGARRVFLYLRNIPSRLKSNIEQSNLQELIRLRRIFSFLNVLLIAGFLASQLSGIFDLTLDRPFARTEWDEPFTLARAISMLHTKGDPIHYDYGGTSIIPAALTILACQNYYGQESYLKRVDQKQYVTDLYVYRKIYPIRATYIVKIVAVVVSSLAAAAFCFIFSRWFLPIPALSIWFIASSAIFSYYAPQMLPTNHLGYLSGIAVIFFFRTLFEPDGQKKVNWLKATCLATSLTLACKISPAPIVLLPLSFLPSVLYNLPTGRQRWKLLLSVSAYLVVPFLVFTPVLVINFPAYLAYLQKMIRMSAGDPFAWVGRAPEFLSFFFDIALLQELSTRSAVMLVVLSLVVLVRRDWFPAAAFLFFVIYSVCFLINMGEQDFYGRHLEFLILPIQIFLLTPVYWLITRLTVRGREVAWIVIATVGFSLYPYSHVLEGIQKFDSPSFAHPAHADTRDDFFRFVRSQNARIYLYDVHRFSIGEAPEYPQVIPFQHPGQLPSSLKPNEFVGYILYSRPISDPVYADRYARETAFIESHYRRERIFGPEVSESLFVDHPQENPTIVLLKKRE